MKNFTPVGQQKNFILALACAALLAACAAPAPVPFKLIGKEALYKGTLFPERQRMEVTVGDKRYEGFYLFASGTAYSLGAPLAPGLLGRWGGTGMTEVSTTVVSNNARATLSAGGGEEERLFCQFVLEGAHALGECKTLQGQVLHIVAEPGK